MHYLLSLLLDLCPISTPLPLEEGEVLPVYDTPDDWRRAMEGR